MKKLPNWALNDLGIDNYNVIDETLTALNVNGTWIPKNLPDVKPVNKYKLHEVYRKGAVDSVDNVANAMVQIPNKTRLQQLLIGSGVELDVTSLSDDEVISRIKTLERKNVEALDKLANDPTFEEIVTSRYETDADGNIVLDKNVKHIFSEDFKSYNLLKTVIGNDKFIHVNENGKVKNFEAKSFVEREKLMASKYYAVQRVLSDEDYDMFVYSSYLGCSPACRPYQGLKRPRSYWESVIFPKGMALHPHCHHLLYPFINGLSQEDMLGDEIRNEPTKNDELYNKEQQMRYNERRIRAQKYKIKALSDVGLDATAEKLKLKNLRKLPHDNLRIGIGR